MPGPSDSGYAPNWFDIYRQLRTGGTPAPTEPPGPAADTPEPPAPAGTEAAAAPAEEAAPVEALPVEPPPTAPPIEEPFWKWSDRFEVPSEPPPAGPESSEPEAPQPEPEALQPEPEAWQPEPEEQQPEPEAQQPEPAAPQPDAAEPPAPEPSEPEKETPAGPSWRFLSEQTATIIVPGSLPLPAAPPQPAHPLIQVPAQPSHARLSPRACPVCGSSRWRTVYEAPESDDCPRRMVLLRCAKCCLMRAERSPEVLAPLSVGLFQVNQTPVSAHTAAPLLRRLVASERLHSCSQALRSMSSAKPVVFEVSHPLASVVRDLSAIGWDVDALVQPQIQPCSEIDLPPASRQEKPAACAFLWYSLDRILHPGQLLAALRERMPAGGRLFVKVHNVLSLESLLAANRWRDLERFSQRRYYFTSQTISRLLESSGFAVDSTHTGCDLDMPDSTRPSPENAIRLLGELQKYLKCLWGYSLGVFESLFNCGEVITVEASAV